MRILLTGRDGQIGWELERALPALGEVVATGRSDLNLEDADSIRQQIRALKPALIVNAAAHTAVDRAETESELALRVNGAAPGVLAEEAARAGALLVHYSTDYIFDGEKRSPYAEGDAPNPLSVYGRSKLEGEKRIAASGCRHLVLRTSWVYAPRGRNFFRTVERKLRAGETLRVVADQHGVPTEARFLAETTVALLRKRAEGLLHVVPSGATTWHGFATEIARRLGVQTPVQAIGSDEYPTAARRPQYSVLDPARLAAELDRAPPPWHSLLERCMAGASRG